MTRWLPLLCLALLPTPAAAERLNVALVAVDPLRASALPPWGGDPAQAPAISAFLSSAAVYTEVSSPAGWTLPAAMSVFTGLYPSRHGLTLGRRLYGRDIMPAQALSTAAVTLPEVFRAAGYRTAAFTGGPPFRSGFGFSRGFEVFDGEQALLRGLGPASAAAAAWLSTLRPGENFFLFVHGFDLHDYSFVKEKAGTGGGELYVRLWEKMQEKMNSPLQPRLTPEEDAALSQTYGERLRAADRAFAGLLAALERHGDAASTVVVLYSHHADRSADPSRAGHGRSLHEDILRVPVALRAPGGKQATWTMPASLAALGPALLSAAGVAAPAFTEQGEAGSLPPYTSSAPCRSVFAETDFMLRERLRSVRACSGWKLISDEVTGARALYHLPSDPREEQDLYYARPPEAAALEDELLHWQLGAPR